MKKHFIFFTFIICGLTLVFSCNDEDKKSKLDLNLEGTHQLRKMTQGTSNNTRSSSSFFLFSGSSYNEQSTEPIVSFAWKMNDGTYALSTLPFGKIRIRILDSIHIPTVKFKWTNNYVINHDNMSAVMKYEVIYAEISAKATDWPQNISLPMNTDSLVIKK